MGRPLVLLGRVLLLVALLLQAGLVRSQGGNTSWEFGGVAGINGYTGDLNHSPFPRTIHVHFGALGRYELSEMYALRFNLLGGGINGMYDADRYFLPQHRGAPIEPFNAPFIALDVCAEIHFLPYQVSAFTRRCQNDRFLAPYVTLGVGGMYAFRQGGGLYLPMGVGVKIAIWDRLTLAPEVRFLKFFTDKLDGYINWPEGRPSFPIHKADWVSLVSITCTYRLQFTGPMCPAYRTDQM